MDWKIAAVIGAVFVAVASFFVFKDQYSELFSRLSVRDGNVSIVEKMENTIVLAAQPGASPNDMIEMQRNLMEHTTNAIGMHPVAFSYFIRSARCSYFNHDEEIRWGNFDHFKELHNTELTVVWKVDNEDVRSGWGGPGIIVQPTRHGKMVLLAYGIEPEDCPTQPGAVEIAEKEKHEENN